MFYLVKTPWLLKKLYSKCIWDIPNDEKKIYLSFDDGPHPVATSFVLDELKKYNAKATFFCIGKNVVANTPLYQRILDEGHRAANHSFNHVNGWKVSNQQYFEDIAQAKNYIDSDLFRPPYGRITSFQVRNLDQFYKMKVVMWSVLSGDFDPKISRNECLQNVLLTTKPGSIIVFHDSEKAFDKMSYALPVVLEKFLEMGYKFDKIHL